MHGLVTAVALSALAGGILVVRKPCRDVDRDPADRVDSLLESIEVDPDEIVDPDPEQMRHQRIRDRRAGIHRTRGLWAFTKHPGGVREVDALLSRLAVAQRDGHVPVARDRDFRNLWLMTLNGEDRDDHDRIGEECAVMPITAIAEEHDVDPLVALALPVDGGATSPSERADNGTDRVRVEGLGKSERKAHSVDNAGAEHKREHDDHRDHGPLSRDPARDDVVSRAAASADG